MSAFPFTFSGNGEEHSLDLLPMQDKYSGDVGDFGKFILLRKLIEVGGPLRLGINWYRVTRPENLNNDGRHVAYLHPDNPIAATFRQADPLVWSTLGAIVKANTRSIQALEACGLLPARSVYFSKPVPYGATSRAQRVVERQQWFSESLVLLAPADVILLDPDNGIGSASVRMTQTRAIKYALEQEICGYAGEHDLVIVYNHRDHSPRRQYLRKFNRVRSKLGPSTRLRLLHFKRFSARDYAFFFKPNMRGLVGQVFDGLTSAPFDFLCEETSNR